MVCIGIFLTLAYLKDKYKKINVMKFDKLVNQVLIENAYNTLDSGKVQVYNNHDDNRYAVDHYFQFVSDKGNNIAANAKKETEQRDSMDVGASNTGLVYMRNFDKYATGPTGLNTIGIFKPVYASNWNNTVEKNQLKFGGMVPIGAEIPAGVDFIERDYSELTNLHAKIRDKNPSI